MSRYINLVGEKFGRLTVLKETGKNKHGKYTWLCVCKCGRQITTLGSYLRCGDTKSCGCLHREASSKLLTTHGLSGHPLHSVYLGMRKRCNNKNEKSYKNYGGRGIKVCDEWEKSFEAFYKDMSPTYKKGLTLDRVDNNKGYFKNNCRWATREVQVNNRRSVKKKSKLPVGVYISGKRFTAYICYNGRRKSLGTYDTPEQASEVYEKAKKTKLQALANT